MQIIYVDESQPRGSINYFIIALLAIKDIQSLKAIKQAITALQRGERKDIKGSRLKPKDRIEFTEKIKNSNYEVYGLVFENCFQETDGNFKSNAIRLLLDRNDSQTILSQVINLYNGSSFVIFDLHSSFYKFLTDYYEGKFDYIQNPDNRCQHELMDFYLNHHENRRSETLQMKKPRIVERKEGNLIDGIMAVDIFANAIKRKYADGCDEMLNLFSSKIKSIQHITSQGGTFSVETVYSS